MMDWLVFGMMVTFSAFYALALQFAEQHLRLVTQETWLTVVVGVGVTVALIGLFPTLEYWKVWVSFACTGSFVVVRSVVNRLVMDSNDRQGRIDRATPR